MIKPKLSLASLQEEDQEEIMNRLYVKRLQKLNREFNRHAAVIQISPGGSPPGQYKWLGKFLAIWVG